MHWQSGAVGKVKRGLFFRTLAHKREIDPPHRKQNLCPLAHYTFLRAGRVRAVSVPPAVPVLPLLGEILGRPRRAARRRRTARPSHGPEHEERR